MAKEGDPFPNSETHIVRSDGERARIKLALLQAVADLGCLEPTTTTRRLTLALDLFRRSVDAWGAEPPTEEQRILIWDHIAEVLELAGRGTATMKLRRSA
jgi:hypothetical protein